MKPKDPSYFNCDVCQPFFFKGGETCVVLLHGFTGTIAHMRPLGEALHERGYAVKGINLPGHATSEDDMGKVSWKDWLQAADDTVAAMRKQYKTVVICGLSMGALLSLILAARQTVDACISISAPLPQSNFMLPLTGFLWFLCPRVAWSTQAGREEQLDQRFDKGYTGFPSKKGADLHTLIRMARTNLANVTCSTLVVQSTADQSIRQTSIDTIYSGITSKRKRKLILHDVPHVCTISRELPKITDAVDELLKTL